MIPYPRESYKQREVEAAIIAWDIMNTLVGPWERALLSQPEDYMRYECIKVGPTLVMIYDLAQTHNYEGMFSISMWDCILQIMQNHIDFSNGWIQFDQPIDVIARSLADAYIKEV